VIALNLLAVSIGIGLVVTVLLVEAFGLAAGGLVVPGYMALMVLQPWTIGLTLVAALATFVIVRTLASFMVVYGRRKTALTILTGYLMGGLLDLLLGGVMTFPMAGEASNENQFAYFELGVIGYIIPGLIAIWFDRQGVGQTIAGLTVATVLVRLSLVVIVPDTLMNYEAQQALNRVEMERVVEELAP
jgi:poly-gamma-glutamate biosynthesis protein PgsC/CapC